MLTEDMIRDDNWREELSKKHGWMGGEHGLYFEHLGGWRFILKDFFERVEATLATPEEREGFRISQVKEKWGSLRIACTLVDDRIDRLVEAAESASEITCDVCGARGRSTGKSGWISTRCQAHEEWRG